MVYTYHGNIMQPLKGTLRPPAKWNNSITRQNTGWCHLNEVSKVVRFIEIESRIVVTRDWEEEEIESCLIGIDFVSSYEKVLKSQCTTMWIYLTLPNNTL